MGKHYYRINKEESHYRDISELLHFSKEEAYILSRAIHSIDQENEIKNNLVEEYPLAEQHIEEKGDNRYLFEAEVASLAGVGRFVLGLIDEVTIYYPESLKGYLKQKIQAKKI